MLELPFRNFLTILTRDCALQGAKAENGAPAAGAGDDKLKKELEEQKEEATKAKAENDRLLQQIKTAQEEQSLKEKLIKELQE